MREHMSAILRALRERRVVEFGELFDPQRGVPVLVVSFLALLELARELLVEITQSDWLRADLRKIGACTIQLKRSASSRRRCSPPRSRSASPSSSGCSTRSWPPTRCETCSPSCARSGAERRSSW